MSDKCRLDEIYERLANLREAEQNSGDRFGVPRDEAALKAIAAKMQPLLEEKETIEQRMGLR